MKGSNADHMEIVDDILVKVIAGGILIGRALRGTLETTDAKGEAKKAHDLATAVVMPAK